MWQKQPMYVKPKCIPWWLIQAHSKVVCKHACSCWRISVRYRSPSAFVMTICSAWLSILVKYGQNIIKTPTVVKCLWEDTFGTLLDKLDMPETTIDKVQISANEKFANPVHMVPIDAPINICYQFKCMHVCFSVEAPVLLTRMNTKHTSEPNAFEVMMATYSMILFFRQNSHHQKQNRYEKINNCTMICLVSVEHTFT